MRLLFLLSLALSACGADSISMVSANVRIDALLADDTESLSLYVLGPWRSDDIMLTCQSLWTGDVPVTDSRVEVLAKTKVTLEPSVTLENVEPGYNRLVFVEAQDAGNVAIGNGCTQYIEVKSGQTVSVVVEVLAL